MTRKFTQVIAVAALFGGLTTSTGVRVGQTASPSPVPHCGKMTLDCWQKDEDGREMSRNDGKCMSEMNDACSRMMQGSVRVNPAFPNKTRLTNEAEKACPDVR
jgi:hypothetical protein